MDYHRQFGIDTKIARIFNTYGPNMCPNDGRVVSNFIMQALAVEDITIYGDGMQTRSFCYVSDTVNALIALMASEHNLPVNIGNPNEITIKTLAKTIISMVGSKSKIVSEPLPDDDPVRRQPVISLAKYVFGWEPKVPLTVGLEKAIEYFKEERE